MAASKSISDTLSNFLEELLTTRLMCQAFANLAADVPSSDPLRDPHAWVFVVSRAIDRLTVEAEELETLVRREALPALQDREAIRTHVAKGHA